LSPRWWKQGKCEEFKDTQTGRTKELDLNNVGGVFIVLAVGVGVAIVICFIELAVHRCKRRRKLTVSAVVSAVVKTTAAK